MLGSSDVDAAMLPSPEGKLGCTFSRHFWVGCLPVSRSARLKYTPGVKPIASLNSSNVWILCAAGTYLEPEPSLPAETIKRRGSQACRTVGVLRLLVECDVNMRGRDVVG